jgi:hypothetical protein
MRYWDELLREQRGDLEVVVDKSWEDIPIRDLFDDSCYDIKEMEDKVNSGELDWFMLRARVFVEGLEISDAIVGGFMYEDARETLRDGTAEDLISQAIDEAKPQFYRLSKTFAALSEMVDNEGVAAI